MKRNIYSVIVILCIVFGGSLFSQDADPVELRMEFSPAAVESGMEGEVVLTCTVVEGYHVSDAASELFGVEFDPVSGIVFMAPEYPPGEEDPYGTVYRGRIQVRVPFSVSNDASSGSRSVTARVTIQPCHEASGLCYAPETRSLSSEMTINKGPVDSSGATEKGSIADRLNRALDSGSLAAILIVFLGGILTSFTPCVYPMIPITIAVIGAQASGGRFRGFVLSLFYVLGIAVTFSTLGFLAAKTGALFGAIAQHPVIVILIASIFLLMGLSMLGLFVIQMPSSLASKLQGKKRRGVLGAILTGLLAGLIVSPCISPLLVVILTWVARSGSVFMGIGLLFSYALGLGILFILVGTFSGILKNLPRSGGWMEIIERAFGILLVILALVYLRPLLPAFVQFWVWAVFFMFLGTGLGAFQSLAQEAGRKQKTGKTLGLLAVIVSACLVFFGFIQHFGLGQMEAPVRQESSSTESAWISSDTRGFNEARRTQKPVLIDFTAEWCAACRELDEKTWPDATVRHETERFVLVKLDLTKNNDRTRDLQQTYKILGMPTIILFTPEGEEMFRFEGFWSAEEMVSILRKYGQ